MVSASSAFALSSSSISLIASSYSFKESIANCRALFRVPEKISKDLTEAIGGYSKFLVYPYYCYVL